MVGTYPTKTTLRQNSIVHSRRPYTFASTVEDAPTAVVHLNAGVGVVFSGEPKRAGRSVTAGLRHVLVASFSSADEADAQVVHTSIEKSY
jgi:nucleoside-diphosphate-sugar epimerase